MDPKIAEIVRRIILAYQEADGDPRKAQEAISDITIGLDRDTARAVSAALQPQDGESIEQTIARLGKQFEVNPAEPTEEQKFGSDVTQKMSDFLNYLSQPVDFESPFAKQVLRQAEMDAYRRESGAGARGGLANLNVQQAYMGAAAGLEQQRQNQLLQALGMGSGRDIGLQNVDLANRQFGEQQYQFDVGMGKQRAEQEMQNRMAMLGLIGGLGGAFIGAPAGPAGMAAGYTAGSKAVAGLAGATGSPYTAPQRF